MIRKWWVKESVFDDVEEEESDGWLIIGKIVWYLSIEASIYRDQRNGDWRLKI